MENLIQFFRYIHIFASIYWVGTNLFMVIFLEPVIKALGPDGSKVMQRLSGGTRFSLSMAIAGWLTVLSGFFMYWPMTGNFNTEVMFASRLPLTVGAIFGIAAGFVGTFVQGRASGQMVALGKEIAAQGGPPNPEQLATISSLSDRIRRGSRVTAVLMVLAVIGMVW